MKKATLIVFLGSLLNTALLSQPCPDYLQLTTQAQVDNFIIQYPNCTSIPEYVTITGNEITNLNGLHNLEHIGGCLNIVDTYGLTSLAGLDNLTSVNEWLEIQENENLVSLSGLDNLESVGGFIDIRDNNSLLSLEGLGSLSQTGIEFFEVRNNPSMVSLAGLNSLHNVSGPVYIDYNPGLTDMTGLEAINHVSGEFIISGNNSLVNLTGLDNLQTIGYDLMISNNEALTGLEGLGSLHSTGFGVDLEGNFILQSLAGLSSLDSIGGDLAIKQCNSLHSLTGLDSLSTINGMLWIEENNALESLSGIDSIDPEALDGIRIIYNPQLCECDVNSICDFLVGPNENITVYVNGPGCNTSVEIEEACFAGTTEPQLDKDILIYVNQASQELMISCQPEEMIKQVTIYNETGQRVLELENPGKISLQGIKPGVYFAFIKTDKASYKKEFLW
jgi:hypothetical protein